MSYNVQRSAKVGAPGLVNFITAVAYHSALACLQHSRNLVHRLWPVSVPSRGNTGLSACPSESRTKNHKPKFKSHPRLARTLHTSTCPLHTPLVQNGTVTLRPLSAAPHCGQSMWRTSISFRAGRSNCRRNPVGHGGIEMFLQSPRLRGHGRTGRIASHGRTCGLAIQYSSFGN